MLRRLVNTFVQVITVVNAPSICYYLERILFYSYLPLFLDFSGTRQIHIAKRNVCIYLPTQKIIFLLLKSKQILITPIKFSLTWFQFFLVSLLSFVLLYLSLSAFLCNVFLVVYSSELPESFHLNVCY